MHSCAGFGSIAANLVALVRLLDLRDGDRVDAARIEAAAEQWLTPEGRRIRRAAGKHAKRRFISRMARWLRFADMLVRAPPEPRHAHDGEVETFAGWLRTARSWTDRTIRDCYNPVNQFFDRLEEFGIPLAAVRIGDIDAQAARWYAGGLARESVNGYSSHLRAFLRFAEGWDVSHHTSAAYAELKTNLAKKYLAKAGRRDRPRWIEE